MFSNEDLEAALEQFGTTQQKKTAIRRYWSLARGQTQAPMSERYAKFVIDVGGRAAEELGLLGKKPRWSAIVSSEAINAAEASASPKERFLIDALRLSLSGDLDSMAGLVAARKGALFVLGALGRIDDRSLGATWWSEGKKGRRLHRTLLAAMRAAGTKGSWGPL